LPYPFEPHLFAIIFTFCFALATVWLIPLMAWPVLGGIIWIVGGTVMRGLEPRTNQFTGTVYSSFERLDVDELAVLAIATLGLAVVTGISIAALRGRISSLLMRDSEEMNNAKRS
jgi:hypothetical protein